MIGVVLWCDASDQKSVFWCEDHGDLAYYDGSDCPLQLGGAFHPGDMVEFEINLEDNIRHARSARLVKQNVCNGLQERLRMTSEARKRAEKPKSSQESNVVAFRRHDSISPEASHKFQNA